MTNHTTTVTEVNERYVATCLDCNWHSEPRLRRGIAVSEGTAHKDDVRSGETVTAKASNDPWQSLSANQSRTDDGSVPSEGPYVTAKTVSGHFGECHGINADGWPDLVCSACVEIYSEGHAPMVAVEAAHLAAGEPIGK